MVPLIQQKTEEESISRISFSMIFVGALEAHLVTEEIFLADDGVILGPLHPFLKVDGSLERSK